MNQSDITSKLDRMIDSSGEGRCYDRNAIAMALSSGDTELLFNALLSLSFFPGHVDEIAHDVVRLCSDPNTDIRAMAVMLLRHITTIPKLEINRVLEHVMLAEKGGPAVESALLAYFSINTKEYVRLRSETIQIRDALDHEMKLSYDLYIME